MLHTNWDGWPFMQSNKWEKDFSLIKKQIITNLFEI